MNTSSKIYIAGHLGMVGSAIMRHLISHGVAQSNLITRTHRELDLTNQSAVQAFFAKDYVRMQWMMLQQDEPEDFVIATGKQYSVCQFIDWSAHELGISFFWKGDGVNEVGYWGDKPIVKIDPRYFRPTEVETLLGDPSKAKSRLGRMPEITAQEMCKEMVAHDLAQAKQQALLKEHGYGMNVNLE
jgi:GDPmannose 4,6-dehydratase